VSIELIGDRIALEDLLSRYAWGVDFATDPEELIALFTDDAVLEGALWEPHVGIEEIRRWAETSIAMGGEVGMRHYLSNLIIDIDGDEARVRAYLTAVYRRPIMETVDATRVLYGTYDCDARRGRDGWRLSRRRVELDVTSAGTPRDRTGIKH
jgi:hypothetical protein